ncbi:hypothetical protein Ait01nite_016100 [Actinoplanes italicus]|uniref:DUF1963 domain-containing protein n=1 Tax=Actinoplanes italicus TaxID=113567 RepID=A0A2T0JZ73_9ACTN|nr:hypothetical protein [Actinoplanes italicus]PRX15767.1 hypothetical protein CLV67_1226 [Actinoplanes italicus]GIE28565.1 hypothetical protein Ait01nite_016100 [Actinoplanes italicus]
MRRAVRYESAGRTVDEPVTKLGGDPVWLQEPQWPLSRSRDRPMPFIGQFRLDDGTGEIRLAYVFMSDENIFDLEDEEAAGEDKEDEEDEDRDDEADDNSVDGTFEPEGGENAVIIQPGGRVPSFIAVRGLRARPSFTEDHLPVDVVTADGQTPWEFLGGEPRWLQSPEPPGPGWRLVGQLSDGLGHNFGDAGIAYIFVSPDGLEGRFLWQCH